MQDFVILNNAKATFHDNSVAEFLCQQKFVAKPGGQGGLQQLSRIAEGRIKVSATYSGTQPGYRLRKGAVSRITSYNVCYTKLLRLVFLLLAETELAMEEDHSGDRHLRPGI